MKNFNYLNLILAFFAIFFIFSCNEKIKSGQGQAYYISSKSTNSPVQNMKYICGEHNGTTDIKGKFTYTLNKPCNFFINNKIIATIAKDRLTKTLTDLDNKVFENNNLSNQILRVIDNDGYADNGIKIVDKVLEVLENKDIPTSMDELKTLSQQIRAQQIFSLSQDSIPSDNVIINEIAQLKEDIKLENEAKNVKIEIPYKYYGEFTKENNNTYSLVNVEFKPDTVSFNKTNIEINSSVNGGASLNDTDSNLTYILTGLDWREYNRSNSTITYSFNKNSGITANTFKRISINKIKTIEAFKPIKIKNSEKVVTIIDSDIKEYTFKIIAEKDLYEIYKQHTDIQSLDKVREDKKVIIGQTKSGKNFMFSNDEMLNRTSGKIIINGEEGKPFQVGTWEKKKILEMNTLQAIFINIDIKYNKNPKFQYFFISKSNNSNNTIWQGRKYDANIEIESLTLYKTKIKDEFIKEIKK